MKMCETQPTECECEAEMVAPGPRAGLGFLGREAVVPLPTSLSGWGNAVSYPIRVRGRAPKILISVFFTKKSCQNGQTSLFERVGAFKMLLFMSGKKCVRFLKCSGTVRDSRVRLGRTVCNRRTARPMTLHAVRLKDKITNCTSFSTVKFHHE